MCVQYDTRSCIGTWFTIGDRVGLVIAMGGGVYNYYGVLYCSTLYMIQPRSSQSHAQFFIIEESGGGLVPGGWMPLMRLILCYRVFSCDSNWLFWCTAATYNYIHRAYTLRSLLLAGT